MAEEEWSTHLMDIDPRTEKDREEVVNSCPTGSQKTPVTCVSATSAPPKISRPDECAPDSGYASQSSTPSISKISPLPRPGQVPFLQQLGLCVSRKTMDAETKQRFLDVQLVVERMLLDTIRKLKSTPGRYTPISIRPMMLGKTNADVDDVNPYMVIICTEAIQHKVQKFFDEPHVKSMCESEDEGIPSFKVLVIGRALKLRSASDITVQCDSENGFYGETDTFCGIPIHLCDGLGHSRNATFGGIVKVTSSEGDYQLYGLTAGHMITDLQLDAGEDDPDFSKEMMQALRPANQTGLEIGKLVNLPAKDAGEGNGPSKPALDWALFELKAHKPNQVIIHGQENSKRDLHLPTTNHGLRTEDACVSLLCASQGIKRGVLSTTLVRVLLDPGEEFADAYTVSLEDNMAISDGDSGAWVVNERLHEVYGHLVADDIFGDAYVIPMHDILADIQRCFGAESVGLPTGLDILSTSVARSKSGETLPGQWPEGLIGEDELRHYKDPNHSLDEKRRSSMQSQLMRSSLSDSQLSRPDFHGTEKATAVQRRDPMMYTEAVSGSSNRSVTLQEYTVIGDNSESLEAEATRCGRNNRNNKLVGTWTSFSSQQGAAKQREPTTLTDLAMTAAFTQFQLEEAKKSRSRHNTHAENPFLKDLLAMGSSSPPTPFPTYPLILTGRPTSIDSKISADHVRQREMPRYAENMSRSLFMESQQPLTSKPKVESLNSISTQLATKAGAGRKLAMPRTSVYQRPKRPKIMCDQCDEHQDGFRGEHELRRHKDLKHSSYNKRFVCRTPAQLGLLSPLRPIFPLEKCKHCTSGKEYGQYYNAAAHLRRAHFKEKPSRASRTKQHGNASKMESPPQKRAGVGGGDWPSMAELKAKWMEEITSTKPRDHDTASVSEDEDRQSLVAPAEITDDMILAGIKTNFQAQNRAFTDAFGNNVKHIVRYDPSMMSSTGTANFDLYSPTLISPPLESSMELNVRNQSQNPNNSKIPTATLTPFNGFLQREQRYGRPMTEDAQSSPTGLDRSSYY